jgi:hypothetical protein
LGVTTNIFVENALSFTTNGQVVANIGTNNFTFTNNVNIATPSGAVLNLNGGASHIDETGFYATQYGSFLSFEEQRLVINNTNVFEWDANGVVTFGNAAATRTNLALGGGITTNRTFVSYNGTNYTTNSVTISNGVITGWTQ